MNTSSNHYRLYTKQNDPSISIKIPQNMLQDIQQSAQENGRELNTEFLIRLGRTLKTRSDNYDENKFLDYIFSGDHDDELFFSEAC